MRGDNGRDRRRFQYQPNEARKRAIEEAASQEGGGFDAVIKSEFPVFKTKKGENYLRIMPPTWEDATRFAYPVKIHRNVGPDSASYLCLRMIDQDCPICEERVDMVKHSENEAAKAIRPTDARVAWVIDRDKESDGPKVWICGWTMEKNIALLCRDRRSGEVLFIDDPDEGYDISFVKEGEGLKTQYRGEQIDRRPSPLHDNQDKQDEWLDYIADNPIPDVLNFYDYDYIASVMRGGASAKETREPERIRSRRSVREEEPEEETRPVGRTRGPEPEPEPDERPARRSREPEPNYTDGNLDAEPELTRAVPRNRLPASDGSEPGRVGRLRPPGQRPSQRE